MGADAPGRSTEKRANRSERRASGVPGKGWQNIPSVKSGRARLLCHTDGSKGTAYSVRVQNDKRVPRVTGRVTVYYLRATGYKNTSTVEQRLAAVESANQVLKTRVTALQNEIKRLKRRVNALDHKDRGKRACPFFYLLGDDGRTFVKRGEIIRNLVGRQMETLEATTIVGPVVRDGSVKVLIREEKDEVSHLDYVALRVDGRTVEAQAAGGAADLLAQRDGQYLVLERGQEVELTFPVGHLQGVDRVTILAEGFYEVGRR